MKTHRASFDNVSHGHVFSGDFFSTGRDSLLEVFNPWVLLEGPGPGFGSLSVVVAASVWASRNFPLGIGRGKKKFERLET